MRRKRWATYLWPGLPPLWYDGAWWGLALAVGFTSLLNLLLFTSLVWTEALSRGTLRLGWGGLGLLWLGALLLTPRSARVSSEDRALARKDDLFPQALAEYLLGNWVDTEMILARILRESPGDVEARLLLATLLRHTGRLDEATKQLDRLEKFDDAVRWEAEIAAERRFLRQAAPSGVLNLELAAAPPSAKVARAA